MFRSILPFADYPPSGGTVKFEKNTACVLAIGNFDGCHLGHQKVITEARACAQVHNVPCAALTFDPHPRQIIEKAQPFQTLFTRAQNDALLAAAGVDRLLVVQFNHKIAELSAENFMQALKELANPRAIFVGENFHFGHNRQGNAALMKRFFPETIAVTPARDTHGSLCSTSAVKHALAQGDLLTATAMLGRPFTTSGQVVVGEQRGRTLGFPTANLATPGTFLPMPGVYAVTARWEGAPHLQMQGVANLGTRPTFSGATQGLEVHVLDFDANLYGKSLEIAWHTRLRDEQKFSSTATLVQQITTDIAHARKALLDVR